VASTRIPASGLVEITDGEFELFRRLILEESGISLSEHKRPLLCARLGRRLRQLSLSSYTEYYAYLRTRDESRAERRELINSITTNKTNFFREAHHFDFLRTQVLEPLARAASQTGRRRLRIWSAACSTGEEPYSIAMTVAEVLSPLAGWDIRILASDIDTDVLARAERGVYPRESAEAIPTELRHRWCQLLSKDEFQVDEQLRQLVTFREINFVREPWPIRSRFDVIFCRNVMIYFDRETQTRICTRFHGLLCSKGFLIAGHSENLMFMAPLLEPMGNTVYRRRATGRTRRSMKMAAVEPADPLRLSETGTGRSRPERARPQEGVARGSEGQASRASLVPHASRKQSHRPRASHLVAESERPRHRSLRPQVSTRPKGASAAPPARVSALPKGASAAPSSRGVRLPSAVSQAASVRPRLSVLAHGVALPAPLVTLLPQAGSPLVSSRPGASKAPPAGVRDGLSRKRIQSGELFASDTPTLVTTLLGSCVAACVFDAGRAIGGMNHFMLPAGDSSRGWSAICFGTNAMELLINQLLELGARRDHLEAHAFGAAHVLGPGMPRDVSRANEQFIREFLAREQIALRTAALGGEDALLVSFETHTGLANAHAVGDKQAEVAEAEERIRSELEQQTRSIDDGVMLF